MAIQEHVEISAGTDASARPDNALRDLLSAMDGQCNSSASRRAARYLSAYYDRTLAPSGLRTTQFTILRTLALVGSESISGLADTIGMDRTTLAANLKPLQREKLLAVRQDEHDQRARLVEITQLGIGKLADATPLWQAAQSKFEKAYGQREAASLRRALAGVLDTNLDPWAD